MFFLLLRPKSGYQFCICDLAIRQDLRQVAKVKCIGAHKHAQASNLGKAPKVFGKAFDTNGLDGAAREVTVLVHVASGGVDDQFFLLIGK